MSPAQHYGNLLFDAAKRALHYLQQIQERSVAPSPEAIKNIELLGGSLPNGGEDPHSVVKLLDECGSPATVATTGGRYFGFVVGGALPVTVATHWLAAAWDQNACLFDLSPVAVRCEEIALSWMLDLLGLPSGCGGAFVTGAQMANFTALAAARRETLKRADWNFDEHGLFGAPPITAVVGEEVHVTVLKALRLLGFGNTNIVRVPTDAQGRIETIAIPRLRGPAIVCANVGNVNSGACDPVAEICDAAREHGAWVHVDGAFGLWAAAAPRHSHLVKGIDAADSWAVDAHKWLNVPHDSGLAIVRDENHLKACMTIDAHYLNPVFRREPMQCGPESSRRARSLEIWASLRNLGREGVADIVERTCAYARRFAEDLRSAGFEILNEVVLNQVLVSFGDSITTERVIQAIQKDGTCWCGGTVWKGSTAMRISVSSWATTDRDVELSLSAIKRIAAEVKKTSP